MSVQEQDQGLDRAAVEAFGGKVVDILNGGMLALMLSIGHRTGLFDAMAGMAPATSEEIARTTGLHERYVREWLGAMTTGGIVVHDGEAGTFVLPPEHAAMLTRAAGPDNFASTSQFVALMGKVESDVVECFRNGGGVPYSAYPEFQTLMAEESAGVFDATLLDVTLPLVAGLTERLREGIDVADVGCGKGHAINLMAEAYPASRFVGFDFSTEGVAAGRAEAAAKGLTNAAFEVRDASALGETAAFDLVTAFDAIHDQRDPVAVLSGIHTALRPGGTFLCVDIKADSSVAGNVEHPLGPMLYTVSTLHCMTVSLALDGAGLGTVWGEQKALQMLGEAGFVDVAVHTVEGDILNNYYVAARS
ncbi:MAG TPA: class I SAM-dependent methyltransferase [Acidimicrobiales bacterium]|nr:class I SAM-dependent methyltransferase [Acidimicrobiales bacterium]